MAEREIRRILDDCNSEDLYGILNVTKSASAVELKRSYRRLALLVHPDKCSADRGTEAFKAVNDAYSILSDDGKRQLFDLHGLSKTSRHAEQSGFRRRHRPADMEELTPEQLFEMFFGGAGGFGGGASSRTSFHFGTGASMPRRSRRRPAESERAAAPASFSSIFIQLLPLLVILFSSLFTSMMYRDPSYSFTATSASSQRAETYRFNIPFYMSPQDHNAHLSKDIYAQRTFEDKVESFYITNLQNNCRQEMEVKNARISRARWWGSSEDVDEANSTATPSCDALYELRKRASQQQL